MEFDEFLRDGKAEPGTARVACARRVRAVEAVEQMGKVLGVNADPGILDLKSDAISRVFDGYVHAASARGVFYGIVDQVPQGLP